MGVFAPPKSAKYYEKVGGGEKKYHQLYIYISERVLTSCHKPAPAHSNMAFIQVL